MTARIPVLLSAALLALAACQQEAPRPASSTNDSGAPAPLPPADPSVQTGTGAAPCSPSDDAMIERGRTLYAGKGICFTCHGDDAKGTSLAPDLTDARWINTTRDHNRIAGLIRTGVTSPKEHPAPMPPMGGAHLSEEDVCAIAAYVYSISR